MANNDGNNIGNSEIWDKSNVSVDGHCEGGVPTFSVNNTSERGGGDMQGAVEYRVFVDGTQQITGTLQLLGGETRNFSFPEYAVDPVRLVRLEVDQRPGHPGVGAE